MAEQYGMKNEMLDVLRKKLGAWEHIKKKEKMKNPTLPHSQTRKKQKLSPQTACWAFTLARMKVLFSKLLITIYNLD